MDDVVGVIVTDAQRGEVALLSWGRLFDPVDPTELESAIRRSVGRFGLHHVTDVQVCRRLGEIASFEYFHEGMLSFAAKMSTRLTDWKAWRKSVASDDDVFARSLYVIGPRMS